MKLFKSKHSERDKAAIALAANKPDTKARKLLDDAMPKYTQLFQETSLSPTLISTALDDYRINGNLQGLSNLFHLFLDADDTLQSAIDVRKEALKQCLWSFGAEMSEQRQKFYDDLVGEQLPDWIDAFIEGKLMGYQFYQILWELRDGLYVPSELVSYQNLDLRIENRQLKLYENYKASELPDYKFVCYPHRRPKLHSIMKYYVFFAYAMNAWAQFAETYGKPQRIGRYDSMTSTTELEVLKSAVKALGADQAAIISKNTEIEFNDLAGGKYSSQSLYKTLCEFVSEKVTKRILGQNLTTGSATVGSYALGQVHNMVRGDIMQADISDLREFVNTILDWVDELNFGAPGVAAWFELPKPVDLPERIMIDEKLVGLGIEISKDHFYDTYGVDRPEKGQEVVELPAPYTPPPMSETSTHDTDLHELHEERIELAESDQSMAKLQRELRALGSIEELREYNPRWFTAEFGDQLAIAAVESYIAARKAARAKNTNLPDFTWEWDSTSVIAAGAFRNQAYIISGVRTKSALADLLALAEEAVDAGLSFSEFMSTAALEGFSPENPAHWKTEFETAKVSAAAAGQWHEFTADQDLFPYLKYVTQRDDLVRDEHRALDGVTAPVGDGFWQVNYPPNGWNCRCQVEQLTAGEAAGEARYGQEPPDYTPDEGFRHNVGAANRLPGGAETDYNNYADGPERELFSGEAGATVPQARPGKVHVLDDSGQGYILDAKGYPVQLGEHDSARPILLLPDEIWQGEGATNYIGSDADLVKVVTVKAGAVAQVESFWKDEYADQGRSGFQERL
jgi:SPP1 gp7 family putative phage head morphogenesis protein